MQTDLAVITTTHNRPLALNLLTDWMKRQTYKSYRWLVVTDAWKGYTFPPTAEVIKRKPKGKLASMLENLQEGLLRVEEKFVAIVEDDEFISPTYLESVRAALEEAELIGVAPSMYYHLPSRTWRNMANYEHASLTASAFRSSVIPFILDLIGENNVYLDMELWSRFPGKKTTIRNKGLQVSFKGLPGASGIGIGHQPLSVPDRGFIKLKELLGQDSKVYSDLVTLH